MERSTHEKTNPGHVEGHQILGDTRRRQEDTPLFCIKDINQGSQPGLVERVRTFGVRETSLGLGTMDRGNMTLSPVTWTNSSQPPASMKSTSLAIAVLFFATFLVGVVGNGLYLWVLGLKMRRTVTTLWFLHLVSCSLLFTLILPFFTVHVLLGFHWVFGTVMCKVLSACTYLGMFSSVFLLALISLDRYTLTCRPVWSRRHRTMSWGRKMVLGVWLASFTLSAPYLAFQETWEKEGGKVICATYYILSRDQDRAETQAWRIHIYVVLFVVRFLLGFLLPFCIIAGCYGRMGLEMKEKGLARSRKPFKVMVAAVVSFFCGWLPYHLYQSLTLIRDVPQSLTDAFLLVSIIMFCFNVCFTPVLYLFVGQTFHQVLRTSLFAQGTMEQNITALPPTTVANSSKITVTTKTHHLASAVLLFITFVVGVVGNGLYLWVLGLKMRRTVTTLWFLHLVSCYLLFTLLIPFFAIYVLVDFHWVFGMAMCKLLNAFISMGMFSSVFLLTLISLDRYTLTHHPIWSRNHRTLSRAWKLVVGVWLASFGLSAPYLAFRETQGIMALPPTTVANSTKTPETMKTPHLASAVLLFITFLVGVVGNGLYLWVLGLKMRRTVTTLWFLHLVSCYLLFTLLIPFFAIYILLDFHWVFGMATCKLLNAFISMGMFSSVFLLTLISLDRYTLTHHPIWSQNHRTLSRARKLAVGVWLASFGLSAPYLAFRETQVVDGGRIICVNKYISGDWNGAEMQDLGRWIHLAIFVVRFLLGFLLPFCTIVGCYVRVG
ncbi:Putative G-protein coupled receptor 33 [Chelonia mydas]|uniref:Probable G-protein coupled receptor 33 n=1 Tax=Chelonia mydas TaxID=8469 RepID=M7BVU1_CHEMY|nr:Putative G-protein coupled receptor 33 [Chelonia mydas]